nr:unnamed protein product [Callosobruchus chinensis]
MPSLKICQWNCRSAVANKGNLEKLLDETNIDIALLSETWFKENVYYNFRGYNAIRNDHSDGKGGVAILFKTNMKYFHTALPQNKKIMNTCITIYLQNDVKLTLISIYIKPQTKITVEEWVNFLSALPTPFILGGDFNAHHTAWGSSHDDIYGKTIIEAIHRENLILPQQWGGNIHKL